MVFAFSSPDSQADISSIGTYGYLGASGGAKEPVINEPSELITSPNALTATIAPTIRSPDWATPMPCPPRLAYARPAALPTVQPRPTPTRPHSGSALVAASQADLPAKGPGLGSSGGAGPSAAASLVPGAPPRTAKAPRDPSGGRTTVTPVPFSSSVQQPTCTFSIPSAICRPHVSIRIRNIRCPKATPFIGYPKIYGLT